MAKSRNDASPMKDAYPSHTVPKGAVKVSGKLTATIDTHNVATVPGGGTGPDDSPLHDTFKGKK